MPGSGRAARTARASDSIWRYGDTIRAIAAGRGLPASRESLQRLGLELISSGWDAFTGLVLQHAQWVPSQALILDGLRHPPAAALRTAVAPLPVITIYLDLPTGIAAARARHRDQDTSQPAAGSAAHVTELALPAVRDHADLIIDAERLTPPQVTGQIISYLESPLGHAPGGRCA